VRSTAVSANLNDSEVTEAVEAKLAVKFSINAPGRCLSLLAKLFLDFNMLQIFVSVSCHIDASVKDSPVDLVVTCLKLPVHQHMRCAVTIPNRVDGRKELAIGTQIDAEPRVWLVLGAAVGGYTSHEVIKIALTER